MKTMKELIKEADKKGYDVIIATADGFSIWKSFCDDDWVSMVDECCVMCRYTDEEIEAMEVVSYDWGDTDGCLFIDAAE